MMLPVGKGTYSNVIRVKAVKEFKTYNQSVVEEGTIAVVKIIRNQGNMRRVSMRELSVLKLLHDEEVHPNIVRLIDDFDYHKHLCFVLEPMMQDLEMAIYGASKGVQGKSLGVAATRRFSRHIFRGLRHMRKKGVIHGDLKPANILVDSKNTMVKLCDYGQATNYQAAKPHMEVNLGSMWYRPPEVILGAVCNYGVDVWQAAVVLYECFTGAVMYPGKSQNDQLYLYQRTKGRFPSKMIKKSTEMLDKMGYPSYFDSDQRFLLAVQDKSSGKELVRPWMPKDKPEVDLASMLITPSLSESWTEVEHYWAKQLVDLLHSILLLNPEARMTAETAMKHKFVLSEKAGRDK